MRLLFAALVATAAAGCSSDTMRFSENPFSNPFSSASADPTPAVPSVPTGRVQSHTLAPIGPQASLSQPDTSIVTGSIHPHSSEPIREANFGNWSTIGGTTVTVAQGDTVASLSSRYGVPEQALRSANRLAPRANPAPGAQIVIPVYRYGVASSKAAPEKVAEEHKHVAPSQKREQSRLAAETKKARPEEQRKLAEAKPLEAPAPKVAPAEEHEAQTAKPKENATAKADAPDDVDSTIATNSVKSDAPQFRWPARGRIICRFGCDGNDGINISVPEGTSVRAAEDGTVAYAGDEIKGYGKLVLVRHANGWVSAYANNGDILVKKGETVKRGEVLAKSGQTGNVSSPQLHFELRKGKTPVDPQQYLAGG